MEKVAKSVPSDPKYEQYEQLVPSDPKSQMFHKILKASNCPLSLLSSTSTHSIIRHFLTMTQIQVQIQMLTVMDMNGDALGLSRVCSAVVRTRLIRILFYNLNFKSHIEA